MKWGWDKACKKVDVKVAQAASGMFRPLTSSNVESHLKNVGLDAEFATPTAAPLAGAAGVDAAASAAATEESAGIGSVRLWMTASGGAVGRAAWAARLSFGT